MQSALLYLPLILLAFLDGQQATQGGEPSWLFSLNTPDGIVLAIGHAPRYVDTQRGFQEARESGYLKLAYQFAVHVEHHLADVLGTEGVGSAEYTVITTDPLVLEQVQNASIVLDSAVIKDGTYILLAIAQDLGDVHFNFTQLGLVASDSREASQEEPPPWTRSLTASPTNATGFGIGYRIVGENEYLAMKDALVNMAASRSIKESTLSRLYQDNYTIYEKILSEAVVDTTIYGARVTKRWYDQTSGDYFVMISTE